MYFAKFIKLYFPDNRLQLYYDTQTSFIKDIQNRFLGQTVLNDNKKSPRCVLYEIQRELLTPNRVTLKDVYFFLRREFSVSYKCSIGAFFWTVFQMSSKSISLFNDEQRKIFNQAKSAVIPDKSSDEWGAKPSPPYVGGLIFLTNALKGPQKTFIDFPIQRFLKPREKHVVTVASSAVTAQQLDDGRTA